jgi:hypothetical protein
MNSCPLLHEHISAASHVLDGDTCQRPAPLVVQKLGWKISFFPFSSLNALLASSPMELAEDWGNNKGSGIAQQSDN